MSIREVQAMDVPEEPKGKGNLVHVLSPTLRCVFFSLVIGGAIVFCITRRPN